jgi:hypothetical protein
LAGWTAMLTAAGDPGSDLHRQIADRRRIELV